ncbi:MAG: type I 3-dehydroquinate dehydratase [Candidatus Helarchaeota archaeon]|nr:type I 3-dehydroquinate dehydratase [Candidatus Helarchaeota archaeon]
MAIKKIRAAIEKGADLIEIRLDYFKIISNEELTQLLKITEIPKIFTVRKKDEGGHLKSTEEERIRILKKCIEFKPEFVDIEYSTSNINELIKLTKKLNVKTIISYHNFSNTPELNELQKILLKIEKINGNISKIITNANNIDDNLRILSLIKYAKNKIVTFAMGEKGIFSRIFSPYFGGFFTFASIEELTAPGQINIENMHEILDSFSRIKAEK